MKAAEKIKKFYNDHKLGCNIAIAIFGAGTMFFICKKMGTKNTAKAIGTAATVVAGSVINGNSNDSKYTESKIEHEDKSDYVWTSNWSEDYRETWDKVHEFANNIKLVDGETYIIERYSDYDDIRKEKGLPVNIVSHLIHGEGVYPNDTEDPPILAKVYKDDNSEVITF